MDRHSRRSDGCVQLPDRFVTRRTFPEHVHAGLLEALQVARPEAVVLTRKKRDDQDGG